MSLNHKNLSILALSSILLVIPVFLQAADLSEASCYECHDELQEQFSVGSAHEPVADGDCESCHDDHGDDYGLVLTDEVPELCFNCHDELSESHLHEPAADGDCQACHSVHNSADSPLLTDSAPALCLECHDEADHSEGQYPHDPVAEGDCLECHAGHQSDQEFLLTGQYASERYLKYSAEAYELCFNCHEQEAFESEDGQDLTDFRHGDTNLHYLHVFGKVEVNKYGMKKQKDGMSCIGCHLTHGTEQPKMIRPSLKCQGTYCYTINYRNFEGGGACVVGCHKPKVYKLSPAQAATQESDQEISPLARQNPLEKEKVQP